MKHYHYNKQQQNIVGKEKEYKNELKEWTFKPKIHKNKLQKFSGNFSKNYKRRNVTEFLQDQFKFENNKYKRLEALSKEREKQNRKSFRPKIDQQSKYLTESMKNSLCSVPVHKRLHEMSNRRWRNNANSALDGKFTYQHHSKLSSK